jgi:hypothetical protein
MTKYPPRPKAPFSSVHALRGYAMVSVQKSNGLLIHYINQEGTGTIRCALAPARSLPSYGSAPLRLRMVSLPASALSSANWLAS